jgi:hypothetical protein
MISDVVLQTSTSDPHWQDCHETLAFSSTNYVPHQTLREIRQNPKYSVTKFLLSTFTLLAIANTSFNPIELSSGPILAIFDANHIWFPLKNSTEVVR